MTDLGFQSAFTHFLSELLPQKGKLATRNFYEEHFFNDRDFFGIDSDFFELIAIFMGIDSDFLCGKSDLFHKSVNERKLSKPTNTKRREIVLETAYRDQL